MIIGAIFFGVGLILSTAAIGSIISNANTKKQVKQYGVQVDSEITTISSHRNYDGDYTYDVYIQYTYENHTYEHKLNWYSSNMYEGKIIQISIDRNNPGHILDSGGNWIAIIVFSILGLVFSLIGGFVLYGILRTARHKKYILKHGHKIRATYVDVVTTAGITINGVQPVAICATYNKDGDEYEFISENLYCNPIPFISKFIDVWVLPDDYTQYYVDLAEFQASNSGMF